MLGMKDAEVVRTHSGDVSQWKLEENDMVLLFRQIKSDTRYGWPAPEVLTAHSNSNLGLVQKDRMARFTSGGVHTRGVHREKSWATTQKRVTLSSADAEPAAGFGSVEAQVLVDSSAALAMSQRKGNGRLWHVPIGQLWVQQVAGKLWVQLT